MNTSDVLRAESKRYRALADKIDALIAEMQAMQGPSAMIASPPRTTTPSLPGVGEYSNLTQGDAIVAVLKQFGPQTTTEIFNRLNAGGMSFKKVAYVTAILARFKEKWERLPDKKISLKPGV